MKIKVKNLGVLKQAEFSLGELTIVCGSNNTGKTYATYALYGFLKTWHKYIDIPLEPSIVDDLIKNGVTYIDLRIYQKQAEDILKKSCSVYTERLLFIFSANPYYFFIERKRKN